MTDRPWDNRPTTFSPASHRPLSFPIASAVCLQCQVGRHDICDQMDAVSSEGIECVCGTCFGGEAA